MKEINIKRKITSVILRFFEKPAGEKPAGHSIIISDNYDIKGNNYRHEVTVL